MGKSWDGRDSPSSFMEENTERAAMQTNPLWHLLLILIQSYSPLPGEEEFVIVSHSRSLHLRKLKFQKSSGATFLCSFLPIMTLLQLPHFTCLQHKRPFSFSFLFTFCLHFCSFHSNFGLGGHILGVGVHICEQSKDAGLPSLWPFRAPCYPRFTHH